MDKKFKKLDVFMIYCVSSPRLVKLLSFYGESYFKTAASLLPSLSFYFGLLLLFGCQMTDYR